MSNITSAEPAADILRGARNIANFTGDTQRAVEHQLEHGRLPAFKHNGIWHMRKSTYLTFIANLEAAAAKIAA